MLEETCLPMLLIRFQLSSTSGEGGTSSVVCGPPPEQALTQATHDLPHLIDWGSQPGAMQPWVNSRPSRISIYGLASGAVSSCG